MSSSTLTGPSPNLSSGVFTDTPSPDIAVSVRGLSKSYSIAKNAAQHTTVREAMMHRILHPFEKVERDTFWALNDVSFDIQQGDVVGIIGRNGAGKSTLLKILSRITEPTKGRIDLYGRVGSLLEVGTGFHPELTGRENIFLNGAILGMKKSEIARQFDAIVDFAEVTQFLDTPVKRYSSGMYVRLAFAVAAHLNPEILIVDEVLAVGDAEFQKKCLGKMQDVADSGRTVLFVSHNMTAVTTLCNHAILLSHGCVSLEGETAEVSAFYQQGAMNVAPNGVNLKSVSHKGTGGAKFSNVSVRPSSQFDMVSSVVYSGCDMRIETTIESTIDLKDFDIDVIITDAQGYRLIDVNTVLENKHISMKAGQQLGVEFSLHNVLLRPGIYGISLWLGRHGIEEIDSIENAIAFEVADNPQGTGNILIYPGPYQCRFNVNMVSN